MKVSIALEELGLPYEAHLVDILKNETHSAGIPRHSIRTARSRRSSIPTALAASRSALFESGAILVYLADKTGKLMPADPAQRYETLQWVFFQMASIGPMFGQFGFFHRFGGKDIEDKRPFERYRDEAKRLLGVLEKRFADRDWVMGGEYHHRRYRHDRLGSGAQHLLCGRRRARTRILPEDDGLGRAHDGPAGC